MVEQREAGATHATRLAAGAGAAAAAHCAGQKSLEERLSNASTRRQLRLRAVVERAAHRHALVRARAAGARADDLHRANQAAECLKRAAAARDAHLAAVAGRAAEAVARAREAAAEAKLRAGMEASHRRLRLVARLERAERARQEALQAVAAASSHRTCPEGFLPRQATRRAQLRRESSSRKLQAAWRAFCEQQQTTGALAQGFAATGVPFTVPLHEQAMGPQPQPPMASTDPTPAGTPDPCSSPTSTVRRHDGRLASAPTSIPQTPHSTPNRTPAHSLAGSPTRRFPSTPLAGPATPVPLSMPPLRSIASIGQAPEPAGSSFERLAAAISSPATLNAAQALLARLEARVSLKGVSAGSCAPLLRRLFPRAPVDSQPRYPARIFLCAYMVLAHPEVVFNSQGEREAALASAARSMLSAFEPLLTRLAEPAAPWAGGAALADAQAGTAGEGADKEDDAPPMQQPLADMLQLFDERWILYLEQFVCWKSADAAGLETELIRVAVELESSRLAKVAGGTSATARLRSPEDIQAIANQVERDLCLIGDRVQKLGGAQGSARLAAALAAVRAAAAPERTAAGQAAEPLSDTEAAGLSRSPSQSPIKKVPRSRGEYSGAPASSAAVEAATLSRSSSSMSVASTAPPAEQPVDVAAALGQHRNLPLVWHLLYDPQWQLSTADLEALLSDALGDTDPMADGLPALQEAAAAAVHLHVKRLAERAFWAALEERLVGGAEEEQLQAVEQVAALLADLGAQLADVLPAGATDEEQVRVQLDREALLGSLPAEGGRALNLQALLALLDWAGRLVASYGAPARDAAAAAGEAAVRHQLASAGSEPAAVVAAAVRALRLLATQLKLLRIDAANVHLRLLVSQLGTEGAAAYATSKFESMLGSPQGCTPEQLGQRLPHTRAWLAAASGQLPHVEQIEAALLSQASAASAAPAQALPAMRAGLRSSGSSRTSTGGAATQEPLAACQVRSWQGLVRVGLVHLVSGEGSTLRLPTPETLCLDGARLHAAQGEFQHLLVTATCLLLVRQSMGHALGSDGVQAAKRRLRAVLSDPAVRLLDIAAECAKLAGGEPGAAREQAMHDSLQRMLSRGAGAFKALSSGLSTALLAMLLLGVDSLPAQAQATKALHKCGASDLLGEVRALASQLSCLAVVTEAVAAPWYQELSFDLL